MAKKKKTKKKKTEVQDFLTKVKELRKINEPVTLVESSELEGYIYPLDFEWRGESYHVERVIGRWKIENIDKPDILDRDEEEEMSPKNCFRVELDNGFQVDLSNDMNEFQWNLVGIDPHFYEISRTNQ